MRAGSKLFRSQSISGLFWDAGLSVTQEEKLNQDFRVSTTVVMQKFTLTHTIKYFAYARS